MTNFTKISISASTNFSNICQYMLCPRTAKLAPWVPSSESGCSFDQVLACGGEVGGKEGGGAAEAWIMWYWSRDLG